MIVLGVSGACPRSSPNTPNQHTRPPTSFKNATKTTPGPSVDCIGLCGVFGVWLYMKLQMLAGRHNPHAYRSVGWWVYAGTDSLYCFLLFYNVCSIIFGYCVVSVCVVSGLHRVLFHMVFVVFRVVCSGLWGCLVLAGPMMFWGMRALPSRIMIRSRLTIPRLNLIKSN